ncbi:MAG: DUF6686 family protein [Paludibacteraceae bacterium]
MKLINSTPNGQIFICTCRNRVHLEFGNIFFNLSVNEFKKYREYVNSIDYKFYIDKNKNAQNRRKLLLHTGQQGSYMALNVAEFLELKGLISLKQRTGKIEISTFALENINLN